MRGLQNVAILVAIWMKAVHVSLINEYIFVNYMDFIGCTNNLDTMVRIPPYLRITTMNGWGNIYS